MPERTSFSALPLDSLFADSPDDDGDIELFVKCGELAAKKLDTDAPVRYEHMTERIVSRIHRDDLAPYMMGMNNRWDDLLTTDAQARAIGSVPGTVLQSLVRRSDGDVLVLSLPVRGHHRVVSVISPDGEVYDRIEESRDGSRFYTMFMRFSERHDRDPGRYPLS